MLGILCAVLVVAVVFLAKPRWLATTLARQKEAVPADRVESGANKENMDCGGERRDQASGGDPLYAKHCAVCHGTLGDGLGRAARYLFPRPRNFGAGGLQMASTDNGVASLEDVERVIARGMPGTSMRAFDALNTSERRQLAQEVLRLRREAVHRQVASELRQAGEEPVEDELREAVERITTPGRPVALPGSWASGDGAVARGRAVYRTLGCDQCHGDDGMGAADRPLFDAQGEPNRARDLVHEPFKGGRERESIYLRVVVGMPGTAHPAAPKVPEDQLKDLVDYVLSLARPPQRLLTNHDRRTYADPRAYRERFGQ
jgi:mono/diheme cytochrome c family protein